MRRLTTSLCAASLVLARLSSPAATFTVGTTLDAVDAAPGNGACASAAGDCTLRAAVMEANALAGADAVMLPAGVYALTIAGSGEDAAATGDLDITGALTVTGAGAAESFIDGGGLDRVLDVAAGAAVSIQGVTIQNGVALEGSGRGVQGGGLFNAGDLSLADGVVARNRAGAGGGIYNVSTLRVGRSSILHNTAEKTEAFFFPYGGGLDNRGSAATADFTSSVFAYNRTGAIHSESASQTGGFATLILVNCTLAENEGGALESSNSKTLLSNVTVQSSRGTAIYHTSSGSGPPKQITIRNSIVSGSCLFINAQVTAVTTGRNMGGGFSCGFSLPDADPRLGPLLRNGGPTLTMALRAGSPAIDAGTDCASAAGSALADDQRGQARPSGSACDLGAFETRSGEVFSAEHTVPIVLDVVSGATGARFSSELTLVNRGTTAAALTLTYTAATALGATGSGSVTETLAPGRQTILPDALGYLRGKGLPIPSGNQGGSLRVAFAGLSSSDAGFAGARTTAPSGTGRAGLSYPGTRPEAASERSVALLGLRDTVGDRTNLALANAGSRGSVTLGVTLYRGDGPGTFAPSPVTLEPGQWVQINAPQLLRAAGYVNAVAVVERQAGRDPFLAYAVFNDNVTNDGSYVSPFDRILPSKQQLLPVLVESSTFESELILANPSEQTLGVLLAYVQSLPEPRTIGEVTETLGPREQKIIPSAIDYLRGRGLSMGARGTATFVGTLTALFTEPGSNAATRDGLIAARTAASGDGGAYGLFYAGVPFEGGAVQEAWVYGLQQDETSRSNLAIALIGGGATPLGNVTATLRYDVYRADDGTLAGSDQVVLDRGGWTQVNAVLSRFGLTSGYVRVVKLAGGSARFLAYGVVNDGKDSASGTNDGSYVAMSVAQ